MTLQSKEELRVRLWGFTILVCIAISGVCGLLITQELSHRLTYEYLIYPRQGLTRDVNALLELYEDKRLSKVPSIPQIDNAKLYVIADLCKEYKMGSECVESMLAIGIVESNFNSNAYRTNTNATFDKGYFQINSIHNFGDYGDFEKETRWTVENLINNGWFQNSYRSVLRHNSYTYKVQQRYSRKIQLAMKLIK